MISFFIHLYIALSVFHNSGSTATVVTKKDSSMKRDGNLEGLMHLLRDNYEILASPAFDSSHSSVLSSSYNDFILKLTPWITGEPSRPLIIQKPPPSHLSCSNSRYEGVLDGAAVDYTTTSTFIVDFVLFGYDFDKLEMRLLESYEYVDLFVLYESPLTHTGRPKPLYFDLVKKSQRFKPFIKKILYVQSSLGDLKPFLPPEGSPRAKYWKLEKSMRYEAVRLFKEWAVEHSTSTTNRKKVNKGSFYTYNSSSLSHRIAVAETKRTSEEWDKIIYNALSLHLNIINLRDDLIVRILGIQNDGDELILEHALQHLKSCSWHRDLSFPIYAPALAFKKNFHWLQVVEDGGMSCLRGTGAQPEALHKYLWSMGPRIWPLSSMLIEGNTMRHVGRDVAGDKRRHNHCTRHLGIGAAVHISAVAEPVEEWLKVGSVVDTFTPRGHDLLSARLRRASIGVRLHKDHKLNALVALEPLSADLIFQESVRPWCGRSGHGGAGGGHPNHRERGGQGLVINNTRMDNVNSIDPKLLGYITQSIPWGVRLNPERYPFLLPGWPSGASREVAGPFATASLVPWANRCFS